MGLATTLYPEAITTESFETQKVTSVPYKGVLFIVNVREIDGTLPTLDIKLQVYDPASDTSIDLASFTQITATGTYKFLVYPLASGVVYTVLPGSYRLACTLGGTDPSFTFSIGANYLL